MPVPCQFDSDHLNFVTIEQNRLHKKSTEQKPIRQPTFLSSYFPNKYPTEQGETEQLPLNQLFS